MRRLITVEAITPERVYTCSISGYLVYKEIIENIKTHVLYIYFGIPKYA